MSYVSYVHPYANKSFKGTFITFHGAHQVSRQRYDFKRRAKKRQAVETTNLEDGPWGSRVFGSGFRV